MENLNESFFKDILAVRKVAKELGTLSSEMEKKVKKDNKNPIIAFKEIIEKGQDIINKSELSNEMKDVMIDGFLGGIYKKLRQTFKDLSGMEIQKKLGLSQELYNRMFKASRK